MNTPRGFNPIGQSAPGLPRHDAPLPGHVSGPSQPIGGADPSWPASAGGLNPAYNGPALPGGIWIGRCIFFLGMYLLAPLQAALYPIAGAAGLLGAGVLYLLARATGGGYDTTHSWAWTGCFLGVVALMRTDTRIADENPAYRSARSWLRLALAFVGMFYFSISDHHNSAGSSLLVAAVFTVIIYFLLRSKWLGFIWHALQYQSWMRSSIEPPPLKQ